MIGGMTPIPEPDKPADTSDPHWELNAFLDDIRDAGMRVTNSWKEMWLIALKYAWGQQLGDLHKMDMPDDWNYIVVNRIYPLMFQNIAKLAKNHPKVLTFAWNDEKEGVPEFVEQWAGILQYVWESPYELAMRVELIMGLLDAAIFGYMVGKTFWDPQVRFDEETMEWEGNVQHTFIHPGNFWTDPSAESLRKKECQNCGSKRRVKVEWAVNRWPKHKDAIGKEGYTSADPKYTAGERLIYENQKASTLDTPKHVFSKLVDLIIHRGGGQGGVQASDSKQKYVDIEEIYWVDHEKKNVKIEDFIKPEVLEKQGVITFDELTQKHMSVEKPGEEFTDWPKEVVREYKESLFPKGRFVLRIGKVILNPKKKEQKYTKSRWPFEVMPYHILPHMWQGGNAVEMARNNNDILNLTVSALVRRTMMTADPERKLEADSLALDRSGKVRQVEPRGLGKYIVMAKGKIDKLQNMEYANLDPATMLLAQILKQDIDDNMFMQDVARGATGGGGGMQQSGSGSKTAREAIRLDVNSQDYTAFQAIFLDVFIDNTMTLIAEILQANYRPERMVRLIGNDREKSMAFLSQDMLDVRFDVNIEPGSTLPFDKEAKKQDYAAAYKILENPIPNPLLEDMLRVLSISNIKKVLLRHQGIILFRQFVMMSQMLQEVDPMVVQAALANIPELQPLYELMMQTAQLNIPVEGKEQTSNVQRSQNN